MVVRQKYSVGEVAVPIGAKVLAVNTGKHDDVVTRTNSNTKSGSEKMLQAKMA
jgi:hypothetical protein